MKRELTWEEFPFPEADLRRAARVAGQALTDALPQPEDCTYRFSQEFQRKMEQLIRKVDRSGWVTGLQRAACFFLALLLSGTAWLTVDAQAREKVFGWLSEHVIDAQRYFHQGDVTSSENIVHYQIKVPEGYWLEIEYVEDAYVDEYYVNEDGKYINFIYQYTTEDSVGETYVIDAGTEKKLCFVRGTAADLYLSYSEEESNTLIWMDSQTGALIEVSAHLPEKELIDLAESVAQIN